ncbi:MAG: glycosyltransferase family 4 protein [Rhodospirillaceae bacterium]
MKILFFTENFPPETNAAATRVFERAVYWARWGHEVTVITCAPNFPHGQVFDGYRNAWHQVEDLSGIRVVRVKTFIAANQGVVRRSLDFLSFLVTGCVAGLFQPKPDVVVSTSPQFFAAVAGWAVGLCRRRPFVFELGDLWPNSISAVGAMKKGVLLSLMEKFELFMYRRSAAVAALTNAFKDNLVARGINGEKIHVVLNGVDLPRYAPRPRDQALAEEWGIGGKFVIGYLGTHGMAHGLINVLDAAEKLADEPDVLFLFVGAGAEREMLKTEAAKRNLTNMQFRESQPKERMPEIWSLCNVALIHLKDSPAFADVLPSKIFEAMGMGLPVLLVSPEGEASRLLGKRGAGPWAPAGDPEALAGVVRSLRHDDATRQAYAEASLNAAPLHSRETQAREMLAVFDRVLDR